MPFPRPAPVLLAETPFVVTDTETTGARPGEARLIEIGATKIIGGEVVGRFQQLVNPGCHVPRRITQLTGITTAMVFDQPAAPDVLPDYLDFLGDGVLVAHNLPFDKRMLEVELDEAGLPPLTGPSLCTLRLARRLLPALPSKGLSGLVRHYGITVDARHRALGDADATAEVLKRLIERLQRDFKIETLEELLAFQHKRYQDTRREPKHLARIREETLPELPARPGVYFMKDSRGRVIYVGKAKSLKARVRSYFSGVDAHPPHTKKLVRAIRQVEWRETGSELRALLDESRLIKRLLPAYNRAQRRYRDYPFLRLDTTQGFPTLSWTPVLQADGAEYFGPLGRRQHAEELVELVSRLFGLRQCDDGTFQMGRACLYATIGRCPAPCENTADSRRLYAQAVDGVRRFLTGADDSALDRVREAMQQAAGRLAFEEAGYYRDQLRLLERLMGRQRQIAAAVHDHHAVLVEPGLRENDVQLFFIRHGRLVETWDLPAPPTDEAKGALRGKLEQHFDAALPVPERFMKHEVDEALILTRWMRHHPERSRQIRWTDGDDPAGLLDAVLDAAQAEPDRVAA